MNYLPIYLLNPGYVCTMKLYQTKRQDTKEIKKGRIR